MHHQDPPGEFAKPARHCPGKGKQGKNPALTATGLVRRSGSTWQAEKRYQANQFLFETDVGTPFDRNSLRKAIVRIGNRAGVRGANVHRFRHTFAINYLRNGGDPYSLQRLLGHSTMEMVKRYLAIAQADLERNHKLASPVDNWRL